MLTNISVMYLQNAMKKPSKNSGLASVVDSVVHKLLISDTTLKSFIPPQVCEMTIKLRHIWGCELCIIPKDIKIHLNRYITRPVVDLRHNYVGRHIQNRLFSTESSAHYKYKVFPCGEC